MVRRQAMFGNVHPDDGKVESTSRTTEAQPTMMMEPGVRCSVPNRPYAEPHLPNSVHRSDGRNPIIVHKFSASAMCRVILVKPPACLLVGATGYPVFTLLFSTLRDFFALLRNQVG
jgi:hypothetical protein